MPSILETLAAALAGDRERSALAEVMRCPRASAPTGVARAGSALVVALAESASTGEGAAAVAELARSVGSGALSEATVWLDKGESGPGPAVVDALLGKDRDRALQAMAEGTDIEPAGFGRLVPPLAPLVLSVVAGRQADDVLDADGLAAMLASERQELETEAGPDSWLVGLAPMVAPAAGAAAALVSLSSDSGAGDGPGTDAGEGDAGSSDGGEDGPSERGGSGSDTAGEAPATGESTPKAAGSGRADVDTMPLPVVEAFEPAADPAPDEERSVLATRAAPSSERDRRPQALWVAGVLAAVLLVAWLLTQVTDDDQDVAVTGDGVGQEDGADDPDGPAGPTAIDDETAEDLDEDLNDGAAADIDADPVDGSGDTDESDPDVAGTGDDDGAEESGARDPSTDETDGEADTADTDTDGEPDTDAAETDAAETDGAAAANADPDADADAGTGVDVEADGSGGSPATDGSPPSETDTATDVDGDEEAAADAAAEIAADGDGSMPSRSTGIDREDGESLNELLDLDPIGFEYYSESISPTGRAALDEVVAHLEANQDLEVEIRGHTDSIGPADLNRLLGLRRARAVRAYLVNNGIEADRLIAVGVGEAEPIASDNTVAGQAANRRIELIAR